MFTYNVFCFNTVTSTIYLGQKYMSIYVKKTKQYMLFVLCRVNDSTKMQYQQLQSLEDFSFLHEKESHPQYISCKIFNLV